MNYWKPQHEVFIRSMQKHKDPTKAYHTAYPKASLASARIGGHRLYNYPHIRERIEPIVRERRAENKHPNSPPQMRRGRWQIRLRICQLGWLKSWALVLPPNKEM
ncbi:hypothetical protein [Polluticoccus soli]|uniref:hypothetical protein n=1 Tax=Polluticoccus soli TaxID=3034150 RepID=UPI0023E2504E|nr:hypothetical protein [Flavipsychrobacter sp. JY13-12]